MKGKSDKNKSMFHYFDMDELVPEDHILRLINKYVDFNFIHDKVKHLYSHTGRPSIDPEQLIKMLLIGYLFGITSERRLCLEVKLNIAYRWFLNMNMDDKVPDHSTFSKNRHGRFKDSGLFREIFDEIVWQCMAQGFISGAHVTVDGTLVKANASKKSMEPIVVNMNSKEYIDKIEEENDKLDSNKNDGPKGTRIGAIGSEERVSREQEVKKYKAKLQKEKFKESAWEPGKDSRNLTKLSNQTHQSTVDPDAQLARKWFESSRLCHGNNYLMDNKNRIIIGVLADLPNMGGERRTAIKMLDYAVWHYGIKPETLGGDKGYFSGGMLNELNKRDITPHIPYTNTIKPKHLEIYTVNDFTYDKSKNEYICPAGRRMKYNGRNKLHNVWRCSIKHCRCCHLKEKCTKSKLRVLSVHIHERLIKQACELSKTKEYRISQRKRKLIEGLFGEAKDQMGMRVAKFRLRWNVTEQFLMTATVQNIKRFVKLMVKKKKKTDAILVNLGKTAEFKVFYDIIDRIFESIFFHNRKATMEIPILI